MDLSIWSLQMQIFHISSSQQRNLDRKCCTLPDFVEPNRSRGSTVLYVSLISRSRPLNIISCIQNGEIEVVEYHFILHSALSFEAFHRWWMHDGSRYCHQSFKSDPNFQLRFLWYFFLQILLLSLVHFESVLTLLRHLIWRVLRCIFCHICRAIHWRRQLGLGILMLSEDASTVAPTSTPPM